MDEPEYKNGWGVCIFFSMNSSGTKEEYIINLRVFRGLMIANLFYNVICHIFCLCHSRLNFQLHCVQKLRCKEHAWEDVEGEEGEGRIKLTRKIGYGGAAA